MPMKVENGNSLDSRLESLSEDGPPVQMRRQPKRQLSGSAPVKIDEKMVKNLLIASLENGDAGEPVKLSQPKRRIRESEEELVKEVNTGQVILDILDIIDDLTERVLDLADQVGVEIE